jgi:hypothetical protein
MTMRRWLLLLLGLAAAVCAQAQTVTAGVGTADVQITTLDPLVHVIHIPWTADTAGTYSCTLHDVYGKLGRVVFTPGAGDDAPTADYDVTVTDEDGEDVLGAKGTDLSATVRTSVACRTADATTTSTSETVVGGALNVFITNAGESNKGTLRIYLLKR